MVNVLDVDILSGLSFALLPVETAQIDDMIQELEAVFDPATTGGTNDVVRFLPIKRLNAVLAVSPQPAYLERARNWVKRLDRADASAGRRVFVYYVKNGRAEDLANTLGLIFSDASRPSRQPDDRCCRSTGPQRYLSIRRSR